MTCRVFSKTEGRGQVVIFFVESQIHSTEKRCKNIQGSNLYSSSGMLVDNAAHGTRISAKATPRARIRKKHQD
ncbi:hypothetical protein E2C01_097297 [Portunus trituberculatus]|uniref:Uncharacterized protein n=1 Tax=Portunus trituberculatus TaxID=210409 RepID=A0A5B7K5C2_PORTR|nr:hypothetical protein [Portunus trituberculatus]